MIQLKWHGELFPETMKDLEKIVVEDIQCNLQDLECPSKLIFHTVFLGKEDWMNGPGVIVWGEEGEQLGRLTLYH